MKRKKSQTAFELVLVVGILLYFFVIFLFVIQSGISEKNKLNMNRAIMEEAENLKREIYFAYNSLDGYSRFFQIKEKLLNKVDYNITIDNGWIYAISLDGKYSYSTSTINITGQVKKGQNIIKKVDGRVYLNP